jgi:hypothetical protein
MPTFVCNGTSTGTGTIQTWTVPTTGPYRIRAVGGQGGDSKRDYSTFGGKGADIAGTFTLTAGQQLKILVGQKGINPSSFGNGARVGPGGGGSFVTLSDNTPLIVAGGGGGAYSADGAPGRLTNRGVTTGSTTQAGAAGLTTNGAGDSWVSGTAVAYAFVNGGKGGGPGSYSNYGGFGGGACTHGWDGTSWCGGGGYDGGDSGTQSGNQGGGSYNSGTSQANTVYTGTGDGFVEITLLNAAPGQPTVAVTEGMIWVYDPAVTWTHVDSDGDPQAKYQLRWRAVI